MSTTRDQVHLDAMVGGPFCEKFTLMGSRCIHSDDLGVAKALGPCGVKQCKLHFGCLIFDFTVDLVPAELVQDGEDCFLLFVPLHVEGVDGHSMVEMGCLVKCGNPHCLWLCFGNALWASVSSSHLHVLVGHVACLCSQNQFGSIGMSELSVQECN